MVTVVIHTVTIAGLPLQVMLHRRSVSLKPLAVFEEHGQMAATLLVIPRQGEDDKVCYDLWVGQTNMSVVILNSDTLEPLMYLDNPLDHTSCPTYLTQLTYSHLTSNIPSDAFKREGLANKPVLSSMAPDEGGCVCSSTAWSLHHTMEC